MKMAIALISLDPPTILQTWSSGPVNVNIPGRWQAFGVDAGWVSLDGKYKIVGVLPFAPPAGQVSVGSPAFSIDDQCNVTQTSETADAPPPPPLTVSPSQFLALLTPEEQLAITTAAQTNPQLDLFITKLGASDKITLSNDSVRDGLDFLVSLNLITQDRIDQIISDNPPSI
jgi:hypothetical protein